jgi:ParB-like chromosome segregation protein Spo0J
MKKTFMIDSEFKSLLRPLTAMEYADLQESIRADGCRHPVVIWNGLLIDGHQRVEICQKLNKGYRIVEKHFATRHEAKLWVIKNQMARRNLNDVQKRLRISYLLEEIEAEQVKEMIDLRRENETLRDQNEKLRAESAALIEEVACLRTAEPQQRKRTAS